MRQLSLQSGSVLTFTVATILSTTCCPEAAGAKSSKQAAKVTIACVVNRFTGLWRRRTMLRLGNLFLRSLPLHSGDCISQFPFFRVRRCCFIPPTIWSLESLGEAQLYLTMLQTNDGRRTVEIAARASLRQQELGRL